MSTFGRQVSSCGGTARRSRGKRDSSAPSAMRPSMRASAQAVVNAVPERQVRVLRPSDVQHPGADRLQWLHGQVVQDLRT